MVPRRQSSLGVEELQLALDIGRTLGASNRLVHESRINMVKVKESNMHSRGVGRGRTRAGAVERWGALIGGTALAVYGLSRRSLPGIALAAGGGTIALLGYRRTATSSRASTWTTLLVNCSPEEAYKFWRDLENLPRFMKRLETVSVLDARRSRWVALGPMGKRITWDAEITEESENQYIAWRSLPDSDVQVDGRVEFKAAPAGRGTLISARLEFSPWPGASARLAHFLSRGANFVLRQDLRRLEALLETGESPTTEGQPHGPRDVLTAALRLADPTRPVRPGSGLRAVVAGARRIA